MEIQSLLRKNGVGTWLILGSLLGAYRDHAHILTEWDIDICINHEHTELATQVLMASRFVDVMQAKRPLFPTPVQGFLVSAYDDAADGGGGAKGFLPAIGMWVRAEKTMLDERVGLGAPEPWYIEPSQLPWVSIRIDDAVKSPTTLRRAHTCHGHIWAAKHSVVNV
jgi:hypothetical protein